MGKKVKPHFIKQNHRSVDVRHIIYFDVETYQQEADPKTLLLPFRLAVVQSVKYDENLNPYDVITRAFTDPKALAQFIDYITTSKGRTYVMAHNAPFDIAASHLLHHLVQLGFSINILRADTGSMVILAKRKKKTIVLLDTLNFLRGSIEAIGKLVGLEKLEIDFTATDEYQLETYCKRDVEIMRASVEQYLHFLKDNDMGAFGYTIAAQANNAFRHKYMHHKIHIHDNLKAKRLERLAYGGGYTMCFGKGNLSGIKFYKTDVNSMYAYIMRNMPMPTRFLRFMQHPTVEQLKDALKYYAVIADVTIHPKTPFYRRRTKEGTIYPTYAFRTCLTTPEVKRALKEGIIIEVHDVALYKQAVIFDSYVDNLYKMRIKYKAEGNAIYQLAVKLLLNALYGKFGTRTRKWTERPDLTAVGKIKQIPIEVTERGPQAVYYIDGKAYTFEDDGDAENTFVAIAAHITAYARMYIAELIEKAGMENVMYTDTDSLIVNETGFANLQDYLDNTELGKLKVEEIADDLIIYGKKDYHFNGVSHIKGVSLSAEQIDENTYIVQYWPSILGTLGSPTPGPYAVRRVEKKLIRNIKFANVKDNRVVPFSSPPDYDPTPLEHLPLPYKEFATP